MSIDLLRVAYGWYVLRSFYHRFDDCVIRQSSTQPLCCDYDFCYQAVPVYWLK